MNTLLNTLKHAVKLAKARKYKSGEEVAQEILEKVSNGGFHVFELRIDRRVASRHVKTSIFISLDAARDEMKKEADRLCSVNPKYAQDELGQLEIELYDSEREKLAITLEITAKEISK